MWDTSKILRIWIFDLRWKIAATLFVVFAVFIGGFSYFSHSLIRDHDKDETEEYLEHIVKISAKTLDFKAFKNLVDKVKWKQLSIDEKRKLMQSEDYLILQKQLTFIKSIRPELFNSIYTLIPTENENVAQFVIDVDAIDDLSQVGKRSDWQEWIVFPGNNYDISDQLITKKALKDHVNVVDPELVVDPIWNVSSLMWFAPIVDPETNEFLGTLGIDLYSNNLDTKDADIHGILNAITAIIIGFALIAAILFTRTILQVRKVLEAKQALEESYEKLRQLDEKKNEFLNIASHELRTPMTSIKWYASMLLDGDVWDLPDEARESVHVIFNQSKRLVRLINDMLDISKIEAGKSEEFVFFSTNIYKLFWQIHDDFISIANEKKIELVWDVKIPNDLEIMIPADRFRQVIINLLGNALKFTPESGKVTLFAESSEKEFSFSISDTWPWIDKKHFDIIFEKFGQAKASLQWKTEWTGLGLAIAKAIVERMEGKISLESKVWKGTVFKVIIPIKKNI